MFYLDAAAATIPLSKSATDSSVHVSDNTSLLAFTVSQSSGITLNNTQKQSMSVLLTVDASHLTFTVASSSSMTLRNTQKKNMSILLRTNASLLAFTVASSSGITLRNTQNQNMPVPLTTDVSTLQPTKSTVKSSVRKTPQNLPSGSKILVMSSLQSTLISTTSSTSSARLLNSVLTQAITSIGNASPSMATVSPSPAISNQTRIESSFHRVTNDDIIAISILLVITTICIIALIGHIAKIMVGRVQFQFKNAS